ncbi:acetylglutamate kinase [Christiangramia flava]|uniref:Acetylglutamate kinase n=1 Tax=Christiangramia flava JLT2011 TaxID=1229726 RepID=A0A1L7HZX0_9FLAO|nr:acetylglutamate kinase [Christiangramia flava]APU66889.1 Acetylglutamate kinase [Christiangramia flava JLT2011]OSS37988.1 Acetylglutamate kinase [Christiangramia flava JLT2011]
MKQLKVIKIGGKLIEDEGKLADFLNDFAKLKGPKILVHGGGNMATEIAGKLGYETKMVDGRRITDENSMAVITMVYGGLINKNIVAKLQNRNVNAIGLCGADGKAIVSKKRPVKEIDFGFVGDIENINSEFILNLLEQGITPVFSAISYSETGELFNTNADSVASEIAVAMSKEMETELLYCFEKKGVLADIDNETSIIEKIDAEEYQSLLEQKVISDGMLPKLHNCFQAIEKGVQTVRLGDMHLLRPESKHTKILSS